MSASYQSPIAIIDIGSNSVRLVVFEPPYIGERPSFNEKVQCGLGQDIDATGRLSIDGKRKALHTIRGFLALCEAMDITRMIAIATAALRDAQDGQDFITEVKALLGLEITIISGEDEARYAGLGVLGSFPEACGVAGDLGGGSLELVTLSGGAAHEVISMPIGVLRILGKGADAPAYIDRYLEAIPAAYRHKSDFYIIGGTWRAITYAYVMERQKPVARIHGHRLKTAPMIEFAEKLAAMPVPEIVQRYHFEQRRAELLPAAALLMHHILPVLKPKNIVVSTGGLRDGLLQAHLQGLL